MSKNYIAPAVVIILVIGIIYGYATAPKTDVITSSDNISLTDNSKTTPTVSDATQDSLPSSITTPTLSISPTMTQYQEVTELKVEDLQVGNGPEVKSGDQISINYLGTLTNGTKFDSSYDRGQPFTTQIGVGQVIEGWDKGVVGMKVGGKRRLIIPPQMGYGERGAGNVIPPNATLIFEVELMGITN
jgi:FKBP-type peptidyl-prolyl cis-trans isomerase